MDIHLEKLYKKWAYSEHRPFKLDFNLGNLTEEKVIKAFAGYCQEILCSKNYEPWNASSLLVKQWRCLTPSFAADGFNLFTGDESGSEG